MRHAAPALTDEIATLARSIQQVSKLTEEKFLEIGKRLERSIEVLGRLTQLFSKLMVELDGEELQAATHGLTDVATQVPALATSRSSVRAALDRLTHLSAAIDRRVQEMRKAVRSINILVINARISAAGIGTAGDEFANFVGGINRSLKLAETNLDHFKTELHEVNRHLSLAKTGESAFDAHHAGTVRTIPDRMTTSVAAIGARRRQAAQAAAQVEARSRDASTRIGGAVMSLQIGDATRQRIEHSEEAVALFQEILAATDEWRGLSEADRQMLVATGCKLQALQLADAAAEFDRDVATVLTSLQELASDAREIVRLGSSALGATDRRGNSFLLELEGDVSAARGLLEGFKTSDAGANDMMASVLDAATRLTKHIGTIQSLEADIRIMGFNTTLKCARLGDVGRGLSVIAHELRAQSHRTAVEAEAITGDVDAIIGAARALGGPEQAQRADDIAQIMMAMSDSIAQLKSAGDTLAAALHSLMADGDTVTGLLDETVTRMAGHKEIGAALRSASAGFERLGAALPVGTIRESDAGTRMLAKLAKRYTMAREREVHAVVAGTAPPSEAAVPKSAEAALDDLLF